MGARASFLHLSHLHVSRLQTHLFRPTSSRITFSDPRLHFFNLHQSTFRTPCRGGPQVVAAPRTVPGRMRPPPPGKPDQFPRRQNRQRQHKWPPRHVPRPEKLRPWRLDQVRRHESPLRVQDVVSHLPRPAVGPHGLLLHPLRLRIVQEKTLHPNVPCSASQHGDMVRAAECQLVVSPSPTPPHHQCHRAENRRNPSPNNSRSTAAHRLILPPRLDGRCGRRDDPSIPLSRYAGRGLG